LVRIDSLSHDFPFGSSVFADDFFIDGFTSDLFLCFFRDPLRAAPNNPDCVSGLIFLT